MESSTSRTNLNRISLADPNVQESVALLKQACLDSGFFYVVDHGINQELMDEVFAQSKKFFDLPTSEKMKPLRNEKNRGYTPMLDETLDPENQVIGDYKEGYYIGVEVPADDPQANRPFYGPNQWPSEGVGISAWRTGGPCRPDGMELRRMPSAMAALWHRRGGVLGEISTAAGKSEESLPPPAPPSPPPDPPSPPPDLVSSAKLGVLYFVEGRVLRSSSPPLPLALPAGSPLPPPVCQLLLGAVESGGRKRERPSASLLGLAALEVEEMGGRRERERSNGGQRKRNVELKKTVGDG